jgi:hypothetical protein
MAIYHVARCYLRLPFTLFEKAQIPRMANPGLSAVERIEFYDAIPDDNFFCADQEHLCFLRRSLPVSNVESKLQLRRVSELFKI